VGQFIHHAPEAGSIDPHIPDLHRTSFRRRSVTITLRRHTWLDIVRAQVSIVSRELLQADGQEEREGDNDEYFTA